MKTTSRRPPADAPNDTVWFGGHVDRWKVALRVYGEELDPDHISAVLCCQPSSAARKGDPLPRSGRWILEVDSRNCDEGNDIEDGIRMLLGRLPSSPDIWTALTSTYTVDIFCGLFLAKTNRGFSIPADISTQLSDRRIDIGFDVYFDPQQQLLSH